MGTDLLEDQVYLECGEIGWVSFMQGYGKKYAKES
jgi:hypothetical protein